MKILCLVAYLVAASIVYAPTKKSLSPRTKNDYGSGATIMTEWYSTGGIMPNVGVFVGHPNSLSRSDRALMRYDLTAYLPTPFAELPIEQVKLNFRIEYLCGKDDVRKIEVSHLKYNARTLGGNDLVNNDAEMVGVVEIHKETATTQSYSLDATKFVKGDLWRGNRYSTFRFRDVDAEAKGNTDLIPTGVVLYLHGSLPTLDILEKL